jgi:cell division protein FtsI (penicillin-binding protein 3)
VEEQKTILRRVYIVYGLSCLFVLAVLARVFYLQFAEGDKWKKEAENFTTRELDIEAVRGNVFAFDGSLLATSLPYYEIGIDPLANDFMDDAAFEDSAKGLSKGLAELIPGRKAENYFTQLMSARLNKRRYEIIARDVSHKQLQEIKKLKLFRAGRYKGGFIYVRTNHRERPFRMLAERTIGYVSADGKVKVGLEGAFDSVLTGTSGKRLMRKIAGGVWMPLNNENEIEPQQGKDIVTTIDVNIQDVAENALLNSLIAHNAKYGCVVLMEVATGEIRAIANLTRQDTGVYREVYNYAVGDAEEPGSTFKLASLLVAMDSGLVEPTDRLNLEGGTHVYYDRVMRDAHPPKENEVSVEEAFWESSNVGISKAISEAYKRNPIAFTDGLHRLRFGMQLGLQIPGEGESNIKSASDRKNWTGVSLPWISIGYESVITPLQMLTLYNAVANNGVMVKPMFVREIRDKGTQVKIFKPEILNPAIAKPQTIAKARKLLEGVVQNGTGKNLKNGIYTVAGKTGTAQIAKGNGYGRDKNNVTYQASFVGYFPADNPKYSCIVIVNAPSGDVYYGGAVAGPIFRQIADRVYATELDIHKSVDAYINSEPQFPEVKRGMMLPTSLAARGLLLDLKSSPEVNDWDYVNSRNGANGIMLTAIKPEAQLRNGIMPDLRGMAAPDVIYLLESSGYRIMIRGAGAVTKQSISPGQKINRQTEIIVELSL